jgi:diguanylate cyclase (GGDEF)-like protein
MSLPHAELVRSIEAGCLSSFPMMPRTFRRSTRSIRAEPGHASLSDIDHFKKINDSHGHTAGDAALRLVAAEIGRVVQGKGNAFRYGGEEFALILPNHSCDEALAVAERARRAIEVVGSTNHNMTCSFGVAVAPIHAAGRDDLLRRADEALYDGKKLGRNLVRLSGEPRPSATATESSRQVSRRAPAPGTISDEAREQLRREILRHGGAHCPACEDDIPLNVHDVTTMGESGKSFLVHCPACGFDTGLPGPRR